MARIYFNDPLGLKDSKLVGITVHNPEQLGRDSAEFLCTYLAKASTEYFYYAQNLTSHLASILSIIKSKESQFKKIYISSHEMAWIKAMLEQKGFQPDATHSNYGANENIVCPTFEVVVLPFESFSAQALSVGEDAIFFVSHASRMTGELLDVGDLYNRIKATNPQSVVIIDGSQALGALSPIDVNQVADVYLSLSSKFVGAEPELGFAFLSDMFARRYINEDEYLAFDAKKHAYDLYSLWQNLQNSLYKTDYASYIHGLKTYVVEVIERMKSGLLFLPATQIPHFITLNFGSVKKNKDFVKFAAGAGVMLSDNTGGWSIVEPATPLVRIGLSVRVTKQDIDVLGGVIRAFVK